jgi:hypothetical protein
MASGTETISKNIDSFRRKYYLNLLLRGLLLSLTIWLSYFLLASLLEYTLWLPAWGRFSILGLFIVIVIFSVYRFLKEPLQFWIARKGLADEQVARLIGSHFPGYPRSPGEPHTIAGASSAVGTCLCQHPAKI